MDFKDLQSRFGHGNHCFECEVGINLGEPAISYPGSLDHISKMSVSTLLFQPGKPPNACGAFSPYFAKVRMLYSSVSDSLSPLPNPQQARIAAYDFICSYFYKF